jgi:hypothetical protein
MQVVASQLSATRASAAAWWPPAAVAVKNQTLTGVQRHVSSASFLQFMRHRGSSWAEITFDEIRQIVERHFEAVIQTRFAENWVRIFSAALAGPTWSCARWRISRLPRPLCVPAIATEAP